MIEDDLTLICKRGLELAKEIAYMRDSVEQLREDKKELEGHIKKAINLLDHGADPAEVQSVLMVGVYGIRRQTG